MSDEKKARWIDVEEKEVVPESVLRIQQLLVQLRDSLETMCVEDQKTIAELRAQHQKIKSREGK